MHFTKVGAPTLESDFNVRCRKPHFRVDSCNRSGYNKSMIKSFKHKGLEVFFYTGKKKGIKPEQANSLERILDRLNAANDIKDMNYPGSNLHPLTGDKKGQYAVNVSGNWRIFFEFIDGDAYIVDYNDYH
jgi:proteic killer suppression protein